MAKASKNPWAAIAALPEVPSEDLGMALAEQRSGSVDADFWGSLADWLKCQLEDAERALVKLRRARDAWKTLRPVELGPGGTPSFGPYNKAAAERALGKALRRDGTGVTFSRGWIEAERASIADAALHALNDSAASYTAGHAIAQREMWARSQALRRDAAREALQAHRPDIDRGQKVLNGARAGGAGRARPDYRERIVARFEELRRTRPKLSERSLALAMEREGLGGRDNIRYHLREARKQRTG